MLTQFVNHPSSMGNGIITGIQDSYYTLAASQTKLHMINDIGGWDGLLQCSVRLVAEAKRQLTSNLSVSRGGQVDGEKLCYGKRSRCEGND